MSKKLIVVALSFVVLTSCLRAEDKDKTKPETRKGDHALIFQLSGFPIFSLTGLNQTLTDPLTSGANSTSATIVGIGYRYYLADMFALRFVPGFIMNSITQTVTGGTDSKSNSTGFDIHAALEWHMRSNYAVSPYLGGGIGFTSLSTSVTPTVPTGQTAVEKKGSAMVFSVGLIAGFEWYIDDGISLGAEYSLGFNTSSSKVTLPTGVGTETKDYDGPTNTSIGTSYY